MSQTINLSPKFWLLKIKLQKVWHVNCQGKSALFCPRCPVYSSFHGASLSALCLSSEPQMQTVRCPALKMEGVSSGGYRWGRRIKITTVSTPVKVFDLYHNNLNPTIVLAPPPPQNATLTQLVGHLLLSPNVNGKRLERAQDRTMTKHDRLENSHSDSRIIKWQRGQEESQLVHSQTRESWGQGKGRN